MEPLSNKDIVIGNKYIITEYNRKADSIYNGMVVEALVKPRNGNAVNYRVVVPADGQVSYNEGSTIQLYVKRDKLIPADRKIIADYKLSKVSELRQRADALEVEAKNLLKFKDDEEETAHKLSEIMKCKDDPEAIAKVLRELKRTNFL